MSLLRRIKPEQTPRRCAVCQDPAVYFHYAPNSTGQHIDWSSKRPVCDKHCGEILEPAGFAEL